MCLLPEYCQPLATAAPEFLHDRGVTLQLVRKPEIYVGNVFVSSDTFRWFKLQRQTCLDLDVRREEGCVKVDIETETPETMCTQTHQRNNFAKPQGRARVSAVRHTGSLRSLRRAGEVKRRLKGWCFEAKLSPRGHLRGI